MPDHARACRLGGGGLRALRPRPHVERIAKRGRRRGFALAGPLAEAAVKETGFGVAEHKKIKNELCSRGIYEHYKDELFVGKRIDCENEDRRDAAAGRRGLRADALHQSGRRTVYFKIMLALMTRNAIIISPAPDGQELLRRGGEGDGETRR